ILLKMKEEGTFEEYEIDGKVSRWLRCRAEGGKITGIRNLELTTPTAGVDMPEKDNRQKTTPPVKLFNNDIPLEVEGEIHPFGQKGVILDTFYIACGSAFAEREKKNSVTITFSLAADTTAEPPPDAVLSWEYWDGSGWTLIPGVKENFIPTPPPPEEQELQQVRQTDEKQEKEQQTESEAKQESAADTKQEPAPEQQQEPPGEPQEESFEERKIELKPGDWTPQPVEVNGYKDYWIRARLKEGHYGKEFNFQVREYYKKKKKKYEYQLIPGKEVPPKIKELRLTYLEREKKMQEVEAILTHNNLEIKDIAKELKEGRKEMKPYITPREKQRTLYLGFDGKMEKGPVSIYFHIHEEEVRGITPVRWQYYSGEHCWRELRVVDETAGLVKNGVIRYYYPPEFIKTKKFGNEGYWIRAVIEEKQLNSPLYNLPALEPIIKGIYLNTVYSLQAETVRDEKVGLSDGTPGQNYTLTKGPVLSAGIWVNEISALTEGEIRQLKEKTENEIEEETDGAGNITALWVCWKPAADLGASLPGDRHYEIDHATGKITFGNEVHGKIPPMVRETGTPNIKAHYRFGGGNRGNLERETVTELKESIPFVENVFNPLEASGGADNETAEEAKNRGTYTLKHRNRAVTAEDFEKLALQASRFIARSKSLPNRDIDGRYKRGHVTVVIIPGGSEEKPTPTPALIKVVEDYLEARSTGVLTTAAEPGKKREGTRLRAAPPAYVEVSVQAKLIARTMEQVPEVEIAANTAVKQYLHPLTGEGNHRGWPFGKLPGLSDFYALLENIDGLDRVETLTLQFTNGNTQTVISQYLTPRQQLDQMELPPHAVVCSGQ
ncbi:MAG: putative baseplate assembly protein, partial [bacterium]|nr:putative baseplate assembly protein [bacterium]